jgi:hypothetical protein
MMEEKKEVVRQEATKLLTLLNNAQDQLITSRNSYYRLLSEKIETCQIAILLFNRSDFDEDSFQKITSVIDLISNSVQDILEAINDPDRLQEMQDAVDEDEFMVAFNADFN